MSTHVYEYEYIYKFNVAYCHVQYTASFNWCFNYFHCIRQYRYIVKSHLEHARCCPFKILSDPVTDLKLNVLGFFHIFADILHILQESYSTHGAPTGAQRRNCANTWFMTFWQQRCRTRSYFCICVANYCSSTVGTTLIPKQ